MGKCTYKGAPVSSGQHASTEEESWTAMPRLETHLEAADLLCEGARSAYACASLDSRTSAQASMVPHTSMANGRKLQPACLQDCACLVILLSALAEARRPGIGGVNRGDYDR